jgi:ribosomal subunit interface protein
MMQSPLEITFQHMERSEETEEVIRQKATKLEQFFGKILACRVVVEAAHRRHRQGNQYHVRIDLSVPGGEIVVNRTPGARSEYQDLNVALRDAFNAARRQLEDHLKRRRGAVKNHEITPHARVSQLLPGEGYGFLSTPDGREIYFHRHSVLDDGFDRLEVGTEVTFVEAQGEKGPQASTVKPA